MQPQIHLPSQPENLTDRVLIGQTLAGDDDAFETLVHRYHVQVFQCIRHYVRDYDQSWDVFQQVLLKLCAALPTLSIAGDSLGPWLARVARNCCLDVLRSRRLVLFSELEWQLEEELSPLASLIDPGPSPEEIVEQLEVQRILHEAINGLPPRLRPVIFLRYMAQLSFAEIGQQLKMPANTAKTYFHRARPMLRATLTAEGEKESEDGAAH